MRRDFTVAVDPSLSPDILGTTDSEVLFHLALTHGLDDDAIGALERAVGFVEATIWAFRYSSEGRSRSLFHSVDAATLLEMYPERTNLGELGPDGRVIVSEPLTDLPGAFHEVPESTVAVLAPGAYEHRPFLPVPPS